MALVSASLDVAFLSNFTGQHRVCWRIVPGIVYDCTTVVYCTGGGAACSVSIAITVDNESCDPVTYEGYVQASCQPIDSLSGRIPFSITFTPIPTCISYRVTCANVAVDVINVVIAGKGYDVVGAPPIVLIGGAGTSTAVANIGQTINIDNAGDGNYSDGVYVNVPYQTLTGIGAGGQATVTIVAGLIIIVATSLSGLDYYSADTFTFLDADLGGGGGTGFLGSFGTNYGTVDSFGVIGGAGYLAVPSVTVDPPPSGITATGLAVLSPCVNQDLGTDCNGDPGATLSGMTLGQTAIECMQDLPAIDPEYTFTPEGCCYDCISVTFTNAPGPAPTVTIYFVDCITRLITQTDLAPAATYTICVVNNSWFWEPSDNVVTVLDNGPCII